MKTYNPCDECNYSFSKCNQASEICKICEFKKMIVSKEQGLLLEIPVAIGQKVYRINKGAKNPIIPMVVKEFEIKGMTDAFKKIKCTEIDSGDELFYRFTAIGDTVFLTQKEAEEVLAKITK